MPAVFQCGARMSDTSISALASPTNSSTFRRVTATSAANSPLWPGHTVADGRVGPKHATRARAGGPALLQSRPIVLILRNPLSGSIRFSALTAFPSRVGW